MSQLSDDTKKLTKNREKDSKIIFGSKWSEENNEPTFRLYQKIDKNREKNRKIILGSEFSKAKYELTFRIHQKNDKKSRKKIEKLFLVQNFLKRIMSQLLNNTNKWRKIEKKNRKIIFGSEFSETNNEPTFG